MHNLRAGGCPAASSGCEGLEAPDMCLSAESDGRDSRWASASCACSCSSASESTVCTSSGLTTSKIVVGVELGEGTGEGEREELRPGIRIWRGVGRVSHGSEPGFEDEAMIAGERRPRMLARRVRRR